MPEFTSIGTPPQPSARQRADELKRREFILEGQLEALAAQRAVKETEFRLKSIGVNKGIVDSVLAIGTGNVTLGGFAIAALQTYKATTLSKLETEIEQQSAAIELGRAELLDLGEQIVRAERDPELDLIMKDFGHFDDPPTA